MKNFSVKSLVALGISFSIALAPVLSNTSFAAETLFAKADKAQGNSKTTTKTNNSNRPIPTNTNSKVRDKVEKNLQKRQEIIEKQQQKVQQRIDSLQQKMSAKFSPLMEQLDQAETTDTSVKYTFEFLQTIANAQELTTEDKEDMLELLLSLQESLDEEIDELEDTIEQEDAIDEAVDEEADDDQAVDEDEDADQDEDTEEETDQPVMNKIQAYKQLKEMYQLMNQEQQTVQAQENILSYTDGDQEEVEELINLYKQQNKKQFKAFVNGKQPKFDVPPQLVNGRTLVPFRAMAEALGAEVSYDQASRTVSIVKGDTTVTFVLDEKTANVNGQIKKLDVPSTTIENRTVIPLRYISEFLGSEVTYDSETGLIFVSDQEEPITIEELIDQVEGTVTDDVYSDTTANE